MAIRVDERVEDVLALMTTLATYSSPKTPLHGLSLYETLWIYVDFLSCQSFRNRMQSLCDLSQI